MQTFFEGNVGKIVSSDQLRKIAGTSEWARRVRELRGELGMKILTHHDRSDLRPGQYLLVSLVRHPAQERHMSKEVRALVLDRDGFTCRMCGAGAGEPHPYDGRRTRLQVGHVLDHSQGGGDTPDNLRALCSVCNEGAANLALPRPKTADLLAYLRRAGKSEQRAVLKWLQENFRSNRSVTGHTEIRPAISRKR